MLRAQIPAHKRERGGATEIHFEKRFSREARERQMVVLPDRALIALFVPSVWANIKSARPLALDDEVAVPRAGNLDCRARPVRMGA